jgi:hypothetical protein
MTSFTYTNEEFPLCIKGDSTHGGLETVAYIDISCEIEFDSDGAVDDVLYIWLGSTEHRRPPVHVSAKHMLYDVIVEQIGRMVDAGDIEAPVDEPDYEYERELRREAV